MEEEQRVLLSPTEGGAPTRIELLEHLTDQIKRMEAMPPGMLFSQVTHYDLLASLLLIESLFRTP